MRSVSIWRFDESSGRRLGKELKPPDFRQNVDELSPKRGCVGGAFTSEAHRWTQAKRIRDYVAHIGACASEGTHASGELSEWMVWALSVVAAMDPTKARLLSTKPDSTDSSSE